jgi:hypothetical protein
MLLIIFLCLFGVLTSVSGDCDIGPYGVKNFDYDKVGIVILTLFLKQVVIKMSACGLYFVGCLVNVLSVVHIGMQFRVYNNDYLVKV